MEDAEVDVRVLGQLLLMQGVAASLPEQAIRSFVTAGLSDIPGAGEVEFNAEVCGEASPARRFLVATDSASFGELVFSVSDPQVFAPYADPVENFAFILALIMEERQQRQQIEDHGRQLEHQVAERTRQLSESERRFRELLGSVRMLAVMLDLRGNVTFCNDYLLALTGWQRQEVIGQDWFARFLPESVRQPVRAMFVAGIETGDIPDHYENEVLTRQGERRLIVWDNTMMRDGQGQIIGAAALGVDLTERKAVEREKAEQMRLLKEMNEKLADTQEQLLQAEKMASVGQLAAGVAHEINNPVAFVDSNLRSLEGYLHSVFQFTEACETADGTPEVRLRLDALKAEMDYDYLKADTAQLVAESKDGLARVKNIVRDLKNFARPDDGDWQLTDVHEGLDSTLNIVWNEIKYHCSLSKCYASDLPSILCLPSQLNQVFMNLLVNAAHAIEGKGEITISTERVGDDSVGIHIRDTGKGIPPEHLKRIFEPFFTTKPVGKGTGLGLSIVWGIVGKHNGTIDVSTVLGQGTTFVLRLPIDPRSVT